MKRWGFALTFVVALALPAVASALPRATVHISGASGSTFHTSHGKGWQWPAAGLGCTATARVGLAGAHRKTSITNAFAARLLVGRRLPALTLSHAGDKVSSISSIAMKCNLRRDYIGIAKPGTVVIVRHSGGSRTLRHVSRYKARRGRCTWRGDGRHGALSTCLYARTSISYLFRLAPTSRFRSVGHTVVSGSRPCRNKSWRVTHTGRLYRLTFRHGAKTRYSQCDILGVHVNITRTVSTRVRLWETTTASTRWP